MHIKKDFKVWSMLFLRVVVGIIFLAHGWQKLQGMEEIIGFFGSLGLAPFFAYLVAWVEFLGGIALILGVFARWAAYALSVVMLVAIFLVKIKMSLLGGYEFDLVLLASLIAIAVSGSGPYSVSSKMCGCGDCVLCGTRLFGKKQKAVS